MVEPTTETAISETNVESEPKEFTQSQVNEIIQKRLDRETAARQKAINEAIAEDRKKREIESLQGEEKLRAEYESKLAEASKAQQERDEALAEVKRELSITKAQAKLSGLGLPPELAPNVIGADDKETDKNIAVLNKAVNDIVTKRVNEGLNHGAPKAGGVSDTVAGQAEVNRWMGL